MPTEQDQPAPQHALKEAVIPIRLDLSQAEKQMDQFEQRIKDLRIDVGTGGGQQQHSQTQQTKDPMSEITTVVKMLMTTNQLIERLTTQMEDLTAAIERNQTGM